ncbi:tellurite resistance TerB family protein, partial [Synechococcus sp. H55.10]|uniref:tellurite resistance TerB family protein n=1 Tax=Synechococcus sp. H55.10 TaxID=2964503 RepID=UPI0039C61C77
MSIGATPASARECSPQQAQLWLRGLLSIAWADGEYSPEEQRLIEDLIRSDWPEDQGKDLAPLSPEELAAQLQPELRQDFLRTAVMTAVADGVYSEPEDRLLHQLVAAFGLELPQLHLLGATLVNKGATSPLPAEAQAESGYTDLLAPLRKWLVGIQFREAKVARFLCRII